MDLLMTNYSMDQLRTELIAPVQNTLNELLNQRNEPEELLTRKEAAKFLKIPLVTLNDWTKRGLVDSGCIGYKRYYKKSSLIAAINKF